MVIKGNKYFKYETKSGLVGGRFTSIHKHARHQPPDHHAQNRAATKPPGGEKLGPDGQKSNAPAPNAHTS